MNLDGWLFKNHPNISGFANQPITALISAILPNIFVIAGLLLLFYAVFGGLKIIMGSGDSKGTEQGKEAITRAVIGFLIIFASYWIVQIIEVLTGISILG